MYITIFYRISSENKHIASEATIRWDVLFLFEVTFIRSAGFAGYEFGNPKR